MIEDRGLLFFLPCCHVDFNIFHSRVIFFPLSPSITRGSSTQSFGHRSSLTLLKIVEGLNELLLREFYQHLPQ